VQGGIIIKHNIKMHNNIVKPIISFIIIFIIVVINIKAISVFDNRQEVNKISNEIDATKKDVIELYNIIEEQEQVINYINALMKEIKKDIKEIKIEIKNVKGASSSDKELLGSWTITAYCPCKSCSGKYGNNSASGTKLKYGYVAAPFRLKFGTKIIIEDIGEFEVVDRFGTEKQNKYGTAIDVFFETHAEVKAFGKKTKKVYTIKEDK